MAIIDIQKLVATEDLIATGSGTTIFPWAPARLESFRDDGQTYMVMGTSSASGFGVATLAKNGRLDFEDAYGSVWSRLDDYVFTGQGLVTHKIGGVPYVYGIGRSASTTQSANYSISVLDFADPAAPRVVQRFEDSKAIGEPSIQGGMDPLIASAGGRDFLIVSDGRSDVMHTYRIQGNGQLGPVKASQTSEPLSDGFTSVEIGKKTFVVSFGQYDTAPIQVLRLKNDGALVPTYDLSPDEPAIYNQQTKGMVAAKVGGQTYLFASEVTRGAILSFKMKGSGELTLVDKIAPGVGDSWGSAEGLETFRHGGETYIISGGYGRSIAIFKVSDGGTLIEVDEFQMETPHLGRVADIEVVKFGGETLFAVSTLSQAPLASFKFVPTDTPITGKNRAETLKGTDEDDQMFARNGNDKVFGGLGDDLIEGGNGNDRLFGQDGHDDIFGGAGRDTMAGGAGDEFMFGGDGNDLMRGNLGNDYMDGGKGADRLFGHDGTDRLFGGSGKDALFGGTGNDRLSDGYGQGDRLTGGDGADRFIFTDDGKRDVIMDFEDGLDLIDLQAEGPMLYTDLKISRDGAGLLIRYGNDTLKVNPDEGRLQPFDLTDSDFIFA